MPTPAEQQAIRTEVLFREVNGNIRKVADSMPEGDQSRAEFLCECGNEACVEHLALTLAEYDAVRAMANCFVVLPGHEGLAVEHVIERTARYVVVRKHALVGAAAGGSTPQQ